MLNFHAFSSYYRIPTGLPWGLQWPMLVSRSDFSSHQNHGTTCAMTLQKANRFFFNCSYSLWLNSASWHFRPSKSFSSEPRLTLLRTLIFMSYQSITMAKIKWQWSDGITIMEDKGAEDGLNDAKPSDRVLLAPLMTVQKKCVQRYTYSTCVGDDFRSPQTILWKIISTRVTRL